MQMCVSLSLVIIPSSIGNLSKLSKLNLTYYESLETFPSSIYKLKLTKLDLHGCSMLKTFPEVLEPSETFAHINLTKTTIKELPSPLELVQSSDVISKQHC
jgi:Leucine-rich repeat (LRR) protein